MNVKTAAVVSLMLCKLLTIKCVMYCTMSKLILDFECVVVLQKHGYLEK